jgi:phosphate transport system substrate-binding protein
MRTFSAFTRPAFVTIVCCALGCSALGCSSHDNDISLQGSGATFPAPLYKRWFLDSYRRDASIRVNYSAIGSGAGIRQFSSGLVLFGASDAGMSKKEIAALPKNYGGVLLLPLTAGCIVLSYNVPSTSKPIRLSREAYLKIFLRTIVNWNDPLLAKDNPGEKLPDQKITVVTRADSSGTTYAFTSHMAAIAKASNLEWTPGVDKSVHWKDAISAQGNDGVSALIQLTPGAIGYVEFGFAKLAKLPMAALENQSHRFVQADDAGKSGEKALEGAEVPEDLQIRVPDPKAPDAYPIVTYTWVLSRKHYDDKREAEALKSVLRHCLDEEQQKIAQELGYVKMPSELLDRLRTELDKITG